jgi:hypothetical protein
MFGISASEVVAKASLEVFSHSAEWMYTECTFVRIHTSSLH